MLSVASRLTIYWELVPNIHVFHIPIVNLSIVLLPISLSPFLLLLAFSSNSCLAWWFAHYSSQFDGLCCGGGRLCHHFSALFFMLLAEPSDMLSSSFLQCNWRLSNVFLVAFCTRYFINDVLFVFFCHLSSFFQEDIAQSLCLFKDSCNVELFFEDFD